MQNSIFLAKLIGPVFVAGAIGMMVNRDGYVSMARDFLHSPALIFLSGLLTMLAGVAILLTHNVWSPDWRVLITVFGWLAAIGGAVRIIFPAQVRTVGEKMLRAPMALTIGGGIWLAIGAALCFFGYVR